MAGWEVLLGPPYARWLDNERPSLEQHLAFWEWMLACIADGPPGPDEGAVQALDDEPLFLYRLPSSGQARHLLRLHARAPRAGQRDRLGRPCCPSQISHGADSGAGRGLVDHGGDSLGGFAVVVGKEVPVAVEREAHRGVAESPADGFHVASRGDEVGAVGVSQIVEADRA